jgi:hypothetical protein
MNQILEVKEIPMKRAIGTLILICLFLVCACGRQAAPITGGTTGAVTTAQQAGNPIICRFSGEPGPVVILNTTTFTDYLGDFHVVGLVQNTDSKPAGFVEYNLQVKDAQGQTLLTDAEGNPADFTTFYPLLETLGPSETSPFDTYVSLAEGAVPSSCIISFSTATETTLERADVTAENVRSVTDSNGDVYIFGELVNHGSVPAHIDSLAGAAADATGDILAASYTMNLVEYLAPQGDPSGLDRGPFGIMIWGPVAGTPTPQVFIDAQVTDELPTPQMVVAVTNIYIDQYDYVHVVGTIQNNETVQKSCSIQVTLQDEGGGILDTYFLFPAINLDPGQMIPFDQSSWYQIDFNPTDTAAISSARAQVDPYWMMETSTQQSTLTVSGATLADEGSGSYKVTGTVTNDSGGTLSVIKVIVYLTDASGTVVGTEYDAFYPDAEVYAAGATQAFEVDGMLPVGTDFGSLTLHTIAVGEAPYQ